MDEQGYAHPTPAVDSYFKGMRQGLFFKGRGRGGGGLSD